MRNMKKFLALLLLTWKILLTTALRPHPGNHETCTKSSCNEIFSYSKSLEQAKSLIYKKRRMLHKISSSWHGEVQSNSSKDDKNVCIHGRLVPELYLLGMPKTGTTTLSTILRNMGLKSNLEPHKETKFFNSLIFEKGHLTEPLQGTDWLNWVYLNPRCPNKRTVVAEYTPEHLMMTPLPPEYWNNFSMQQSDKYDFDYHFGFPGKVDLPMVLMKFYGTVLSRKLTFIITMREPLALLQSAFYFMCCIQKNIHSEVLNISANEFTKNLQRYVKNSLKTSEMSSVLYARHLKGYLQYFPANQFYMIPYRFIFHQNLTLRKEVIDGIFMRLNLPLRPIKHLFKPLLSSAHPNVTDTVPEELVADFQRLILPENQALVKLLAEMSRMGCGLAAYSGGLGREPEISTWLNSNW